ncbi:MAG: ABC transporter permease subunit [Clostridiaceae bacterium]|nr:ABC transporter permease subunit [Clostridiaceae bacterium]
MNIYRFEMRLLRNSIITWALTLAGTCAFFLSLYPVYANNVEIVKSMMAGFPPGVLEAFGINMDTFFSLTGFYALTLYYVLFFGAIQAVHLGLDLISRENRSKTSDFLLTKPVNRRTVIAAKYMAALTALVITNLVYLVASTLMCLAVKNTDLNLPVLLLISLTLFFAQLAFLGIGALIATFFTKIKSVSSLSLSVAAFFFVLSMIDTLIGKEAIRYITPFKYFDNLNIIENQAYQGSSLLTVFGVCLICAVISIIVYVRRDVAAL